MNRGAWDKCRNMRGLSPKDQVEARLWDALRTVEDPEIPVSVVGMGLIVSLTYQPEQRLADLKITFTAMGCPAMDFIEEDIREALLKDPDRRVREAAAETLTSINSDT